MFWIHGELIAKKRKDQLVSFIKKKGDQPSCLWYLKDIILEPLLGRMEGRDESVSSHYTQPILKCFTFP